jgi:hypothetical protein
MRTQMQSNAAASSAADREVEELVDQQAEPAVRVRVAVAQMTSVGDVDANFGVCQQLAQVLE